MLHGKSQSPKVTWSVFIHHLHTVFEKTKLSSGWGTGSWLLRLGVAALAGGAFRGAGHTSTECYRREKQSERHVECFSDLL